MNKIKIIELDQFLHEVQTWDRSLDFYMQETAILKTRLALLTDKNTSALFLDFAEHVQSKCLFVDDYIAELKADIRLQMSMIRESILGNHSRQKALENLQKKLRKEMVSFEKKVTALKYDFNQRLATFLDAS